LPNYNYQRGRAREYQVIIGLKQSGWVCTRSAMSHGPVDIIAAKRGKILLLQVKSGSARVTKAELKVLKSWARAFNADAEIWSFRLRGKVHKERVFSRSSLPKRLPSLANDSKAMPRIEKILETTETSPAFPSQIETPSLIS
jgi:Holliday junction resolvase